MYVYIVCTKWIIGSVPLQKYLCYAVNIWWDRFLEAEGVSLTFLRKSAATPPPWIHNIAYICTRGVYFSFCTNMSYWLVWEKLWWFLKKKKKIRGKSWKKGGKEEIFTVLLGGGIYHFGKREGGKNINYLNNIHPWFVHWYSTTTTTSERIEL